MANAYMSMTTVTAEWQALAAVPTVLNARLFIWATMAEESVLRLRCNGGAEVQLGTKTVDLVGVDLSTIEVKGATTYRVTVIGYTR